MLRMCRALVVLLLSSWLVACPSGVRKPPPAPPILSVPPAADLRGAEIYRVDSAASDVHILVFRGGTLARLGHNHVMSVQSLTGQVWVHPDPAKSGFDVSFPVAGLVVDDPQARRAAGADFPGEIPQADRAGTRRNMLRAEVLDGEHFPRVQLQSIRAATPLAAARFITRITIKDMSRDIEIPVAIDATAARVIASGQFDIRQTDFGIQPFSIGLGALEVVDQLQIRFKVVADRK